MVGRKLRYSIAVIVIIGFIFGICLILRNYIVKSSAEYQYVFSDIIQQDGWTQIGQNILISHENGVNMTLVTSGKDGVLIDTGFTNTEASRIKKYIIENEIKLKTVILTHLHQDHTRNLRTFEAMGAKVYKPVDMKNNQLIRVGKTRLKLLNTLGHQGSGHFSVELVKENILIAGDVIMNDWVPYFDSTSETLLETIQRIEERKYAIIIPGHGEIMESEKTVQMPVEYLKNARNIVRESIQSGKTEDALINIKITDCSKEYAYLEKIDYLDQKSLNSIHQKILKKLYGEETSSK